MPMLNQIISLLAKLLCGGQQNQHQQQQQQQQGFPPPQQHQQQWNQQQQGYPPQQQPSWSQVAGGQNQQHHGKPHHQQQQQQHQAGSAQDYYQNQTQQPNGQQWSYQPQHAQYGGYPSKPLPAGGVVGPHHPGQQNSDQINATNEQYVNLRNQARRAGDEAHRCFAASQQAYQRGDGAKAHELSQEGKRHQAEQDKLDDQASDWIYTVPVLKGAVENNRDSPVGTIDLHGLYVKEAIERTEAAIADGQRSGMEEMRVIVGKGIHSQGHVAKIKPAVQDLMRKYHLSAHIDPHNTGVLVVDLQGRDQGGRSRDAGGLVDDMEKDETGCVIM